MNEDAVLLSLKKHLPPSSVDYCHQLWKQLPFHLKITKSRHSKAGDFFCAGNHAIPRITINDDLNPCLFLITYIHEVSHLHVFQRFGNKVNPHGEEWKQCFKALMLPMLTPEIFPDAVLRLLARHMKNPKASSFADAALTKALRLLDEHASTMITVSDLPDGSLFVLRGKYFKKGELKRTRFLCHEVKSKRKYLVPAEALVSQAQLSLL